jgi:hypothetical protein
MAISRPFLLALLGVALLAATVFAVQNARNSATDDPAPVAKQQPAEQAAPAPAEPAQPASPQDLLASAFSSDVESASFKGSLAFSVEGARNVISTQGAFVDNGPKEMPEIDINLRVRVPSMGLNERGGFVTNGERAWFTRRGTAYVVPGPTWNAIAKARESGRFATEEDSPEIDVDPSGWLSKVKAEGKESVGGVEATHISAEVDSAKAITDIVKGMADAGESSVPLPNAEQRLRQSGLTNGELDVWVGDDKILRRVTLALSGRGDGNRRVTAELDFQLSDVNEPQRIARPAKVKSGMPGGVYGQVANGVLSSVAESAGLKAEELNIGVPVTNSHVKAERAVADNKKVVIFFKNPRALDDKAVADSVRSLDRRLERVVVLSDDVRNVKRYGSLLEDLGVSQAPAIVVIGQSGEARLIEGYVDADSLVQVVADAR